MRAGTVRFEKPLERVEHELLDRQDDEGAGAFARLMTAHAVGDQKDVGPLLAMLQHRLRQAGLPDSHRLAELGNQELIFVGCTDLARVADAKRLGNQRRGVFRDDAGFLRVNLELFTKGHSRLHLEVG